MYELIALEQWFQELLKDESCKTNSKIEEKTHFRTKLVICKTKKKLHICLEQICINGLIYFGGWFCCCYCWITWFISSWFILHTLIKKCFLLSFISVKQEIDQKMEGTYTYGTRYIQIHIRIRNRCWYKNNKNNKITGFQEQIWVVWPLSLQWRNRWFICTLCVHCTLSLYSNHWVVCTLYVHFWQSFWD